MKELQYILWATDNIAITNIGCGYKLEFDLHTPKSDIIKFSREDYNITNLFKDAIDFVNGNSKITPIGKYSG